MEIAVAGAVELAVVQQRPIERFPICDEQALVHVVRRVRQPAAEQHARTQLPSTVPLLAAREADNVPVVPRAGRPPQQGQLLTRVDVFASDKRVSKQAIVPFVQALLQQDFHAIGPTFRVKPHFLVAHDPEVRPKVGQGDA